ncbi:MAG: demethoxyubiquinone hydroxylase family protein [Caulobacteraceae bacterium]|nr:demethoxyubiquinone hydroxylase family protein [Caulobacter sp.]
MTDAASGSAFPFDSSRARTRLHEMLRVDHAGELGAVHIYRGQNAVFAAAPAHAGMARQMAEHEAQEQVHLSAFDDILARREVRPTALAPLWRVAGFALGAATALMGEKAAHACTEAVESVIEQHYAEQIEAIEPREPELARELQRFRDDEIAHHDHAVAHGSRETPGHLLLTAAIKAGCRLAIKISEKV